MPLASGTRLGAYEIASPLGAGGMGDVYRARDTRLDRDVALKTLPPAFVTDAERVARFEREAKTLAALNHPHIAQIYGVEESGDTVALVMELVTGEDLAARLARGPLPVDEAIRLARQIAEALDAAHSAGIVHRDLKPANIKVREDGAIKVLDFGLAKALESAQPGGRTVINSPTITSPLVTHTGVILGTAAYMSPEQARGRAVDKRADIWAFGCVLYEMLTGRAAFDGESVADVLGAIVRSDPDWTALPSETPHHIKRLLRRCIEKDQARRLRDIGDAIAELAPDAQELARTDDTRERGPRGRSRARLAFASVASLLVVAGVAAALGYRLRPAPDTRVQKFQLATQADGAVLREPVISPDGRKVVYVGRSRLWVHSLDEWEPRELPGTEGAMRPFWSPGSDWIGYFRSEMLLKVPVAGGPVVRIGAIPAVQAPLGSSSASWTEDGTIAASLTAGPLLRVAGAGGDATPFPGFPKDIGVDLHDIEWLPGGGLLGAVHRSTGVDAIGVLKDGAVRIVYEVTGVHHPAYSTTGHLIFERRTPNAGIWAVPFSLDRLQVTGEPFLISEGTEPSVARDGTLSFLRQPADLPRQLAWFSLNGQTSGVIAEPRQWTEGVAISPDGRRVLASTTDGIWAYDIDTGVRSRMTTVSSDITPAWVDADRIVFVRTENSDPVLMMKQLHSGEERVLARRARFPHATADGRRIVFNILAEARPLWQIAWIDLDRPDEIKRLGGVHDGARFPSVSPDGTLVSYVSGEIGRDEIFLTRLPSGDGKYQLSSAGGGWTSISPKGDAAMYRTIDGEFMSVPIAVTAGAVKIGRPQKLFDWGAAWAPYYTIAKDGTRGVTAVPVVHSTFIPGVSVVRNWIAEFTQK